MKQGTAVRVMCKASSLLNGRPVFKLRGGPKRTDG